MIYCERIFLKSVERIFSQRNLLHAMLDANRNSGIFF